jgi:hypothetical protein
VYADKPQCGKVRDLSREIGTVVDAAEKGSFEGVMRDRTLSALSGVEDG